MPEVTSLLKNRARETGLRLDILEKDYALSYLLAAIAEEPFLGEELILKGGTALRKCYYPDYRFSEDLDFSTRSPGAIPDLDGKMSSVTQRMNRLLGERGPFQSQVEPFILREPHPFEQAAFLVRVQFPAHRQPLCRLKVEITVDEPLLLPQMQVPILHDYEEALAAETQVYQLAEIIAEKLRALLQSKSRLSTRGWGASRVCRDYYDLWSILQREQRVAKIPDLVKRKCVLRNLTFDNPADFFADPLPQIARAEWKTQILPFVPEAPSPEQVLSELEIRVQQLWE
jgi:predicted nucleotidyltransferase component of viral defense system